MLKGYLGISFLTDGLKERLARDGFDFLLVDSRTGFSEPAAISLGWMAEFRIPLGQLRFSQTADQTFGRFAGQGRLQ